MRTSIGEITDYRDDTERTTSELGAWIPNIAGRLAGVGPALTPGQITALRDAIEFAVVGVKRVLRYERPMEDDKALAVENALTLEIWHLLDQLCMLAGGYPQLNCLAYAMNDRDRAGQAEAARYRFAATCNRLLAEVEPDAHVASVNVTVHNADGSEVTYSTAIDMNPQRPAEPIWRTVHSQDHNDCVTIDGDDL